MGDALAALTTELFVAALVYVVTWSLGEGDARSAALAFLAARPVTDLGRRLIGRDAAGPAEPETA